MNSTIILIKNGKLVYSTTQEQKHSSIFVTSDDIIIFGLAIATGFITFLILEDLTTKGDDKDEFH